MKNFWSIGRFLRVARIGGRRRETSAVRADAPNDAIGGKGGVARYVFVHTFLESTTPWRARDRATWRPEGEHFNSESLHTAASRRSRASRSFSLRETQALRGGKMLTCEDSGFTNPRSRRRKRPAFYERRRRRPRRPLEPRTSRAHAPRPARRALGDTPREARSREIVASGASRPAHAPGGGIRD